MTPEQYQAMDPMARSNWVDHVGPQTPAEEDLVVADPHPFVRTSAAIGTDSERLLQLLSDRETDEQIRDVIATNPAAPFAIAGAAPLIAHSDGGIHSWLRRSSYTDAERELIWEAVGRRERDDKRSLAQAAADALAQHEDA